MPGQRKKRPPVYIVAELGANAAPFTRERLMRYISAAKNAGADAVKVQLFRASHFPNKERASKVPYEFPRGLFPWFVGYAHRLGLGAGASVFDEDACDLVAAAGCDFLKLATREQHNTRLREYANTHFHGTILRSVDISSTLTPDARLPREVTLGCIPRYPTPLNRRTILDLLGLLIGKQLPVPFGYSSHTAFIEDCLVAVAAGARVIEKHLVIFKDDPEERWSLPPGYFRLMARVLREAAE